MTVTVDAPLPAAVLASLRSWSSSLTVDLVVADLVEAGAWGASVSVGGVVRTFGLAEHGGSWTVPVLAPDGCTRVVELGDGALASSDRAAVEPERTHPRRDGPQQPDDITWAVVQADMAWQAQVLAGGLVGLAEEAALARLDGHVKTALLYRRDRHMLEIRAA
jgi:thiamine biosynthesis lipoprotein ApbE